MHYELNGSGSPSLVLVHGFACDHMDWTAQAEALRERHRVATCDLRGYRSTPGKPPDCSIETCADVAQLVEALQLAPAVPVGHSLGCRVVLEAACQRPRGVGGLALVDGSVTASGDPRAAELASIERRHKRSYTMYSPVARLYRPR